MLLGRKRGDMSFRTGSSTLSSDLAGFGPGGIGSSSAKARLAVENQLGPIRGGVAAFAGERWYPMSKQIPLVTARGPPKFAMNQRAGGCFLCLAR